jgi:kynurenine formamidase
MHFMVFSIVVDSNPSSFKEHLIGYGSIKGGLSVCHSGHERVKSITELRNLPFDSTDLFVYLSSGNSSRVFVSEGLMCHVDVFETIAESVMTDRRRFLAASLGLSTCSVLGAEALASPIPQESITFRSVVDLTHQLHEDFPTYFGTKQFFVEKKYSLKVDGLSLNEWRLSEHVGTHIDAPLHFSEDGKDVSELPIDSLYVPLAIIDVRESAARNVDYQVTPEDIHQHIKRFGPLPKGCCVAMQSGWSKLIENPRFRGETSSGLHFPGFHVEAVELLLGQTEAIGIAVDTLSLDYGQSKQFESHKSWLPTGRWGIECLNLMDSIPARGAYLFVGCPKVRRGTGGPSRVVAFLP